MDITELKIYFENTAGLAVLSTSDASGNVNSAVYGRPHFTENNTLSLVMNDRRSHLNLQSNPLAAFLFVEEGSKSKGIRLYLKKISETDDPLLIDKIRRHHSNSDDTSKKRFLVDFSVEAIRPLVEKDS